MYSFLKIIERCIVIGNVLDSNHVTKMHGIKFIVTFVQHASRFDPKWQ
jgi:hypothetical protein